MAALRSSVWGFSLLEDKTKFLVAWKTPVRVSMVTSSYQKADKSINIGILGVHGKVAGQLIGHIGNHPSFKISLMTNETEAGKSAGVLYPYYIMRDLPKFVAINDADFCAVDGVFCCLPINTSQEIIKSLPDNLKIIDLSGGFSLVDVNDFERDYGAPHRAIELQKEAVYGLPELYRNKIKRGRLVANAECFPTMVALSLVPLIKAGLVELDTEILIVFVLGTNLKGGLVHPRRYLRFLYDESVSHLHYRPHVYEIQQELSAAVNSHASFRFTTSMSNKLESGLVICSISVKMASGVSAEDLTEHLKKIYQSEEFVEITGEVDHVDMKPVQNSNMCEILVANEPLPGYALITSAVDTLGKGFSGQAVQNLNLLMGIPENTGLGWPLYSPIFG